MTPVHSVSVPSAPSVTDFGGAIVRHSVDVIALGPKLASISQLMFFEGEKNSVPVDVWGTSVPEVCGALDVVERVVVGVAAEVVVVVGDEVERRRAARAGGEGGGAGRQNQHADGPFPQRKGHRTSLRQDRVRIGSFDARAGIHGESLTAAYRAQKAPERAPEPGVVVTEIPNQLAGSQFAGLAGGIVAVSAIFIALFSLVLLVPIILIVANRAEPDQRGQRSHSVYLFGMSFVTLQLTFAGSVLIVTSLLSVIAPHVVPLTNSIARSVVIGGLLVVLFGAMLLLHLGRGIEIARGDGALTGPNLRVMQSYAGVVGFIYLLQLITSLALSIYLLFALIAPGVFGSFGSSRSGTLAMLLDLVYVMLASAYVLRAHSSLGPSAFPGRRPPAEVATTP